MKNSVLRSRIIRQLSHQSLTVIIPVSSKPTLILKYASSGVLGRFSEVSPYSSFHLLKDGGVEWKSCWLETHRF